MKKTTAFVLLILGIVSGCNLMPGTTRQYYQVRLGNRSDTELRSIVIDPDGLRGDFGYFGVGQPKNIKGAGFCEIRFEHGFAIEWNEEGQIKRKVIDIKKYEAKKNQIKSFGFYYLGNGKWRVIARAGTRRDSSIINPE